MYDPDMNAAPINPLPWVVVLLVVAIGGIELVFQAAEAGYLGGQQGIGWRLAMVQKYAFSDTMFDWMRINGLYSADNILRFFSYSFIHQTFMHAVFAVVFVLAIGKFVAEVINPFAVLAIFFGSAAGAAAIYSIALDQQYAMIGAYPAIYGLIGAFTWLRFTALQGNGQSGLRAFNLIIFFMAIALIYKFMFGGSNDWLAELIGFCVGFGFAIIFGPDSKLRMQMILVQFRRR
ncbi:MAG: rhomboid family intramembrane serine protease [Gammaproteobacteria bacterium]|nr:rhomboid family intramembrane serine protease [Gammaproteobacteria bacterium]